MTEYELAQLPKSETGQRMLSRVSPIYENSYFMKQFYDAIGTEWEPIRNYFTTLHEQRFIQTVSWGIEYLEHKYSLDPRPDLDLEERRRRLGIRAFTKYPLNPAVLERFARDSFGLNVYLDEKQAGYINLIANHLEPDKFRAYMEFLYNEKPAHLAFKIDLYWYEYIGTDGESIDGNKIYVPPDIGLPEGDRVGYIDYVPVPTSPEDRSKFPCIFFGMAEFKRGEEQINMPKPPNQFDATLYVGNALFYAGETIIGNAVLLDIECPIYFGCLEVRGGEIIIDEEFVEQEIPETFNRYIKECPIADLLIADVGIARGYTAFDFEFDDEDYNVVKVFFSFPISRHRRFRAISLPNPRDDLTREDMKAIGDYVAEKKLVMNSAGEYADGAFAAALKLKTVKRIF